MLTKLLTPIWDAEVNIMGRAITWIAIKAHTHHQAVIAIANKREKWAFYGIEWTGKLVKREKRDEA